MLRRMISRLSLPLLAASLVVLTTGIVVYATHASAAPESNPNLLHYENAQWHFALDVPADMTVSEDDSSSGPQFSFSDKSGEKQFIVSTTPYSQMDMTLDHRGDASTVSDQPDHLEIVNVIDSDIFEVWFVKNGVLYEVRAVKALEPWLINILKSWQFN